MSFDFDAALVFDHVSRRFGRREGALALDGLCLEVAAGGAMCLVGPNGAGKSTALALAAGLLAASSGEIRFGGRVVIPRQPAGRLGYLPQHSAFPPSLLVREVLDFAVVGRQSTSLARDEVIELGDLASVLDCGVGTLSTGWIRRLGLAIALLEPIDLLLLDEPFVGLDLATLERTLGLLLARSSTGTTLLLSSHDFEIVDRLAPEIAVLDDGKLLAVEALVDWIHPQTRGAAKEKGPMLEALEGSRGVYQRALGGAAASRTPNESDSRSKKDAAAG